MFRTVFSTLGGSFFALFGVVLTADVLISRSRKRAVLDERALADEKFVANKLELENQQLRQLNEERDRFLSMVSHELRTPLTTIMGFTDVLRKRQDGEKKERNRSRSSYLVHENAPSWMSAPWQMKSLLRTNWSLKISS